MNYRFTRCHAFTLIELLVVIATIALLLGALIPVTQKAKASAKELNCASNLRQIAMATQIYLENNNDQLIVVGKIMQADTIEEALSMWHIALLPYICENIKQDISDLLDNTAELWFCPADKDPYPIGYKNYSHKKKFTSYAPNGYYPQKDAPAKIPLEMKLGPAGGYKISHINTPSDCMLIGETSFAAQFYDADAPKIKEYDLPLDAHHRQTSGFYHNHKMNVLFVDGHIESIKGKKDSIMIWPKGFEKYYESKKYMYWPDLTLKTAKDDLNFWGPGY